MNYRYLTITLTEEEKNYVMNYLKAVNDDLENVCIEEINYFSPKKRYNLKINERIYMMCEEIAKKNDVSITYVFKNYIKMFEMLKYKDYEK